MHPSFDSTILFISYACRSKFYENFYGAFDDQFAAMDAILNGKEAFACQVMLWSCWIMSLELSVWCIFILFFSLSLLFFLGRWLKGQHIFFLTKGTGVSGALCPFIHCQEYVLVGKIQYFCPSYYFVMEGLLGFVKKNERLVVLLIITDHSSVMKLNPCKEYVISCNINIFAIPWCHIIIMLMIWDTIIWSSSVF